MLTKSQIRTVANLAAGVISDSGAKQRVQSGYTRVDPFRIAQSTGVIVMLRPLEKLFGAFVRQKQPGILVNSERPAGLIQMTCAHELGHFFLGHETTTDDQLDYGYRANQAELEADWFAYSLVAPRWAIANIMRKKRWSIADLSHPFVLYQLSLRLGISYQAAAWSLNRLELIDKPIVDKLLRTQPAKIKGSLLGRPLENPQRDIWLLDESDQDFILEPRAGDQILVRLKSHTSAGYVWIADETASKEFSVEPLMLPASELHADDPLIAGGTHYQDYLVSKPSIGHSHLRLNERKTWNPLEPALDSYSAETCFENLTNGLSPVAKEALLQGEDRA